MEIILKIENNNFSLKKYLSFSASMHFYDMRIKWSPIRELFFAHIALHLKYQKLKVSQNFHEIFFLWINSYYFCTSDENYIKNSRRFELLKSEICKFHLFNPRQSRKREFQLLKEKIVFCLRLHTHRNTQEFLIFMVNFFCHF